MKKIFKKIKFVLQLFDGIWSLPIGFAIFFFVGYLIQKIFGYTSGFYDPAFIQPLFLSIAVVVGATNAAILGLYFSLRGFFRYLYGSKNHEGTLINFSKIDWKRIAPTHRMLIVLSVLIYFITAITIVYIKLI